MRKFLVILLFLNLVLWKIVFDISGTGLLKVVYFDVGQGDSIFIETPQGHQLLVDGGPDSGIIEKLGLEVPFWDRTIDMIILTHPEHDHIAGLLEVLKNYKVENILWTGVLKDTAEFSEWQRLLEEEDANVILVSGPMNISFGESELQIIHPFESFKGKEIKDVNDTSIVFRLVYGETSFLFTGDIYKSAERELVESGAFIDSDVLKVAHHGSKTSSLPEFIRKVSPLVSVIQVGRDNSYGHPAVETLEVLKNYGINILRTDQISDIKLLTNKETIYGVSNF